ncbi:hypothetical protein AURDEDRAFT_167886 [Auricularia subglabra TFB-10046 SS5]|nr:hypothetical protein AURDEDRAFT_167886 [Auricularia subglabra TFB-10046 SS5]
MALTRFRTFGWSTPCAASISCGPEQTPRRRIAPIPKRAVLNRPAEIVSKPFTQAGDSEPSAGRKRKRDAPSEDEPDASAEPPRKLPRVTLIVRPPKLFITIPRRQVLARIKHNNRTITLLGRERISVTWRPAHTVSASAPAVRSVSEPAPTRRSKRIMSRQASVA